MALAMRISLFNVMSLLDGVSGRLVVGDRPSLLTLSLDVYDSEHDVDDGRVSQSVIINDIRASEDLHDLMDDHL